MGSPQIAEQQKKINEAQKFPSEPISAPKQQETDLWMIGLTFGLIFVGVGQVWVLIRQTAVMAQQAAIMDRQRGIIDESLRVARDSLVELRTYVELTGNLAGAAGESNVLTRESNEITKAATDLTRQSVALAQRSADTLVNSERAWVVVTDVQPPQFGPGCGPSNEFCFDLTNRGRTVARLTGPFKERFHLVPLSEKLPELPDYGIPPDFPGTTVSPILGRVLSPGERNGRIELPCWNPQITIGVFEDIQARKASLYFYASLKYFDFADQERELQFCCLYLPKSEHSPEQWVLGGPREYNKHT